MSLPLNKQNMLKLAAGAMVLTIVAMASVLWIITGQLVSPSRRAIQNYHLDYLNHPSAHGIRLYQRQCDQGRVPCLFVTPDPAATPGKRGAIIRTQLELRGISLKPYGETHGILLLLHGRNGRKEDLLPAAERFAALGFNCVIPDLPAHGDSPVQQVFFATTHFEQHIANNVLTDARNFFADQASPAGIWGLSMGGAYAINAVSQSPSRWKAMVVVSSFDSLEGVVQDKLDPLPRNVSVFIGRVFAEMVNDRSGLVLSAVQPVLWANHITIPVLMAHGDMDPLISAARGKRLFYAFHSQTRQWVDVPGGNHNNILVTDMPLYAAMGEWFVSNLR